MTKLWLGGIFKKRLNVRVKCQRKILDHIGGKNIVLHEFSKCIESLRGTLLNQVHKLFIVGYILINCIHLFRVEYLSKLHKVISCRMCLISCINLLLISYRVFSYQMDKLVSYGISLYQLHKFTSYRMS